MSTFMSLMHEFEQLVDDRLQELPMGLKEARVLADNVHYVGCHDSFIVLAAFHFSQP
jgi:hypothetical protein